MFYIFNKDGNFLCSGNIKPNTEDHESREEIVIESDNAFELSKLQYLKLVDNEITMVIPASEVELKAKAIRNNLRSQIDTYLLPAATYKDELVSQEVKDKLIQDSLLLAKWPTTENWPNIPLPTLSDSAQEMIEIPTWPEVK